MRRSDFYFAASRSAPNFVWRIGYAALPYQSTYHGFLPAARFATPVR
jgi:hypothetical protein